MKKQELGQLREFRQNQAVALPDLELLNNNELVKLQNLIFGQSLNSEDKLKKKQLEILKGRKKLYRQKLAEI